MNKKYAAIISAIAFICFSGVAIAGDNDIIKNKAAQYIQTQKDLPAIAGHQIPFIANEGQIKDSGIKFYTKTINGNVYVNDKREIIYYVSSEKKYIGPDDILMADGSRPVTGFSLKEFPVNANNSADYKINGIDQSQTAVNYFIGNNPSDWRSNINTYSRLDLGEIWDGIFLHLKAGSKNIEKLFIISPNADVNDIQISVEGSTQLVINKTGELKLETIYKNIGFTKPVAFQEIDGIKKHIEVAYRLVNENTYGFIVSEYDKNFPLIIDPLLSSTYLGGNSTDIGRALIIDPSNGDIFVAAYTLSSNYPVRGAADDTWNGGYDVVVSKFNSNLSQMLSATFIGGPGSDGAFALAMDKNGNIFVTGQAGDGFPTLSDLQNNTAFDTSYNGGAFDVFVSKLNNNLSALLASTFIGGTGANDAGFGIGVDDSNNVFVTGYTNSQSFPTSAGAYDNTYNGSATDIFVSKFNNNLSSIIPGGGFYFASTFLGGGDPFNFTVDFAYGLAIDKFDSDNNIFIAGLTNSFQPLFPTTPGVYDSSLSQQGAGFVGGVDAIIAKFNNSLTTLMASTFLGGTASESAWAIALGLPGANTTPVFVTGTTSSPNFPITLNAYNYGLSPGLGASDVFVSKLDNNLTALLNSTWLGGTDAETSYAIMQSNINSSVYIAGTAESNDYPTTDGSFATRNAGGGGDCFITEFSDTLNYLVASTFIGGTGLDIAYGIASNGNGDVVIAGQTSSSDYPVWPDITPRLPYSPAWPATNTNLAYSRAYNGGTSDVFVTIIDNSLASGYLQPPPVPPVEQPVTDTSSTGITGGSSGGTPITLNADSFRKPLGSCFIATSVFSNPMNTNVVALRNFRDSYLLTNRLGQNLVENYYRVSPQIAKYLNSNSNLNASLIRIALIPIALTAKYPLLALGAILILALAIIAIYRRRMMVKGI